MREGFEKFRCRVSSNLYKKLLLFKNYLLQDSFNTFLS